MKITASSKSSVQGTALLVTLFLCLILSVTVAGYLKHASQQHRLSMRSQSWNLSIAVTEAGIEEGLQHLNANYNNLASQGWTQSGSTYSRTRVLSTDSAGATLTSYTVMIDGSSMSYPQITAQAFINDYSLGTTTSTPVLAVVNGGVVSSPNSSSNTKLVTRAIRVTASRNGLFLKAMVAKHKIDMNGNNVMTDSFDSSNPAYSSNGRYPAGIWWKLLDNGDVASNDTIANTISGGNANIYGRASVGPGGTVSIGSNGGVGTRAWQAFNTGLQPGYFTDDMNFTFPTVALPYSTGLTPTSGSVSTTNYIVSGVTNSVTSSTYPSPVPAGGVATNVTYTTSSSKPSPVPYGLTTNTLTTSTSSKTYPAAGTYVGTVTVQGSKYQYNLITGTNYTYPNFTYTYSDYGSSTNFTVTTASYDYIIQGGAANLPPTDYYLSSISKANILVLGNARLVVAGDVKQSGQDKIIITSGGKLQMWVGGTSLDLSGQGVMNQNGYAQNFICWCADSVTDVKYSGNGEFTGILVAPNASVKLAGGGNADQDFVGALIADNVTLNGHYSFHYDEALKNLDSGGRYKITQWNEIPAAYSGITYVGN